MKTPGIVRHDVTFQCPVCGHIDTINMPIDGPVDCDECGEDLELELEDECGQDIPRLGYEYWRRKD